VLNIKDSVFENQLGNYDLESATYDNDDYIKSEINLEGNNTLNIDLTDENYLNVKGIHNGKIRLDRSTLLGTHLIYENDGKTNGEIIDRKLVIYYKNLQNKDTSLEIYIPDGQEVTPYYINQQLQIEKEGYLLYFYNESDFTTKWDYKTIKNKTIYGNWEKHNHALSLTVKENAIVEICECGKLGNKLFLQKPSDLQYNGDKKPIQVINELGILDSDYTISYMRKNSEGWTSINDTPTNIGLYKVNLTYNELSIEMEYEILGDIENPKTGDNNIYFIIVTIIICVIGFVLMKKNSIQYNL
jgi:hypothetical protein